MLTNRYKNHATEGTYKYFFRNKKLEAIWLLSEHVNFDDLKGRQPVSLSGYEIVGCS
jgi:hypothetical protein